MPSASSPRAPRSKSTNVIGWREWLSLPDFGILEVKAKIDTGARSSSLHAFHMRRFQADGREMVRFKVHPLQRSTAVTAEAEAELIDERVVRSSGGHEELRPVVRTTVELMGERFLVELTLTRRDQMGFRMLLGRQAVRGRFLVDSGRSFLARTVDARGTVDREDGKEPRAGRKTGGRKKGSAPTSEPGRSDSTGTGEEE